MSIAPSFPRPMPYRTGALAATLILLGLALGQAPAGAKFNSPPPDQPDMVLTPSMRTATIDSLAAALERSYVFPDVAARTAAALRTKLKKGAYGGLDSAMAFADSLSSDLRAIGKDRHFR